MMGTLIPDEDFTVWFGTNPNSRKVTQIQQNPEVALYYIEEGNSGYVMLQGTAQLINSTKEKEIHWKDDWKPFYPNYPEDYILIKVTPNWMEVVSYKHNIVSKSRNWEPPKIVFD
jgi:general stress protein 26